MYNFVHILTSVERKIIYKGDKVTKSSTEKKNKGKDISKPLVLQNGFSQLYRNSFLGQMSKIKV